MGGNVNGKYMSFYQGMGFTQNLGKFLYLLFLDRNDNPKILREIQSIDFKELKLISLIFNNLESMEGFARVRMPVLEILYIGKF